MMISQQRLTHGSKQSVGSWKNYSLKLTKDCEHRILGQYWQIDRFWTQWRGAVCSKNHCDKTTRSRLNELKCFKLQELLNWFPKPMTKTLTWRSGRSPWSRLANNLVKDVNRCQQRTDMHMAYFDHYLQLGFGIPMLLQPKLVLDMHQGQSFKNLMTSFLHRGTAKEASKQSWEYRC